MNIRAMAVQDTDQVLCMMRVFYDSPAVLHKAPNTILLQDIADCVGECPFIEGYIFEEDGQIAGERGRSGNLASSFFLLWFPVYSGGRRCAERAKKHLASSGDPEDTIMLCL